MLKKVIELYCPGCGARVDYSQQICEYCHKPVVISTVNDILFLDEIETDKYFQTYENMNLDKEMKVNIEKAKGLCCIKLGLYDEAIDSFKLCLSKNNRDDESMFYLAIAYLRGNKAYLQKRKTIDECIRYIQAALKINKQGIYYYFWAYILYDYFFRKHYDVSPEYNEVLMLADNAGISESEIKNIMTFMRVEA